MATVIIPNFTTGEKVYAGLNTYTYTIQTAGMHTCKIRVSKRASSNMTISITQAGSVNATLATITVQPESTTTGNTVVPLRVVANCAVGDVISFVLTSSLPIDQELNTVKSEIIVTPGSNT